MILATLCVSHSALKSPPPAASWRESSQSKMRKSILYNQNFFKDQRLVELIVRRLNIGPNDFVYEIGPGRGIITAWFYRVLITGGV
ncbi:hypothetical protein COW80_04865 [Candidatus Beckwithbacteria bacterium CG22_combo_CG10-13_8_21_14_all_01_47_9]|uniref:Ribosomal RNA adenine methylase transferase N-terminal domain-containing protein n=1 Tax=Candidatus Beckwithbacteria bacterium CG22_combo_CG10-13_8_21_14_all_01_47_9 TaxID=1974496 RepID=A0A2H0DZL9_9BACT|nr:MAG: hypothetical protein COW80_04865 [Candidatus Beckwithbacteria bacterium CG22_combo_CG10-13_8_21_14_all_01_47_9]